MNVLSVCDGIGAAHVAWHGLGWRPYVLSEIEPFPRAVLAHHYCARDARFFGGASDAHVMPEACVPHDASAPLLWGDFTALRERFLNRFGRSFAEVDLLAGGTPCQAFSVAGNRRSLADARGNLTLSYVRLADAIDAVRRRARRAACWIVWENVPGVLNTRDNAFGAFLGGLCGSGAAIPAPRDGGWPDAGVVAGPARCAAWRVLDAQHFGLAQRRRRVVVVARGYFGGAGEWDGPDALLPVVESVRWHPAPGREARQDVAGTLGSRPAGSGGLGTDFDLGGGIVPLNDIGDGVSHALTARHSRTGRYDPSGETFISAPSVARSATGADIAHELRGEGFDASEDGTGRGTPLVPICFDETQITSAANRSNPQAGEPSHPLAAAPRSPVIAFDCKASGRNGFGVGEVSPTLRATAHRKSHANSGGQAAALSGFTVRRLTPRECERLQGFPDDYTRIPWRGGWAADGPRYKALGNSWAVPKFAYVGARIALIEDRRSGVVA